MNSKHQWNSLELGTCYYPEQWDKGLWASDLERMKKAGIRTVRIAEFAWSKVEPTEGNFTFDFWDEFLELAQSADMKVIFCTPTATPPAWLTSKYPEVLAVRIDGVAYRHGMRCHYNYNSEKYLELASRVVTKLAEHYGKHPSIVGWQIGNEQNCELSLSYSEADDAAFNRFLREKYEDSLDALNNAWGTVFWNQTYSDWSEVHVPGVTPSGGGNPHQQLDFVKFISDSVIRFTKLQSDILRRYIPENVFITTNGLFGNLDNHRMMDECLDVFTYDSYPNFAYGMGSDPDNACDLKDRMWSRSLTATRSISNHFGIMEQQSGPQGWVDRMEGPAPKPGQLSLWAMQSIAHGADFVSFFRWRTACFGTEMYWHGILDYDNRDNRRLEEVTKLGRRIDKLQEICGSEFVAEVAILTDYDNEFDSDIDKWHGRLQKESVSEIFIAAQLSHTPIDFCDLRDTTEIAELLKYKVLFYPHPEILTPARVNLLTEYVNAGGILILGARCGQKDANGHCVMMPMPGLLSDLCGADVKEFTFVGPADSEPDIQWDEDITGSGIFMDILQIDPETQLLAQGSTDVLATYMGGYYNNLPALVETKYGKGRVLQFGGTFTRKNASLFLKKTGVISPYRRLVSLSEDCELTIRRKGNTRYLFILNYSGKRQHIGMFTPVVDIEKGETVDGLITVPAYGVSVFKLEK